MVDSTDSATSVVSISEDYRKLTVPQNQLILGCVGDAWVRRVYFTAPRYCDDTDLSGYDFTVQFINNANESDLYEIEDLAVEEDALTFSWLVSPIACAVVGNTGVSIVASNVDDQTGETLNRFITTTFEWKVLPSTTAEDGELIEAQSYVEMRVAEWQAEIDEAISKTNYRSYDTVADMQADDTLSVGMTAHTLGFHAAGDGGAAWYKVASHGIANGMDILQLDNGKVAELQITESYVTPEMFGAWGDGEHDDYQSFSRLFELAHNVKFSNNKEYSISDSIALVNSGVVIDGNNSLIYSHDKSCFVLDSDVHDYEFINMNIKCDLNDDGDVNCCIIGTSASNTDEFESYNIDIHNSYFYGGVTGVSLTNAKNVKIYNCIFEGCIYRPELLAGGYGILLQSCVNATISDCSFKLSYYGRHDIYISVKQTKTANRICKNVVIENCKFDHSNITVDHDGQMYSPNTVCIHNRATIDLLIQNIYAYKATGILFLDNTDGDVYNATIKNLYNDSPIWNTSPDEIRQTIGVFYTENNYYGQGTGTQPFKLEVDLSAIKTINPSAATYLDASLAGTYIHIHDMNVNYQVQISHVIDIDIDNIYVTKHGSFLYTYANESLTGSIKNITSKDNASYIVIVADNHNISPSFIKDVNLFKCSVANSDGTVSFNGPYVRITSEIVDSMIRLTFTDLNGVPSNIVYQPITYRKTFLPSYGASGDAANQMRLLQYDTNNTLTTNYGCRLLFA